MLKRLKRFSQYPFTKKLLFFETVFWSLMARAMVFLLSFSQTKHILGLKPYEAHALKAVNTIVQTGQGKIVSAMINTVNRYLPWKNTCLVQAITGKILLKRKDIESVIVMGLRKDGKGELKAHAWLLYTEGVVTGFDENGEYTPVAYFI